MSIIKPFKYCIEYMVTGVHAQIKESHCLICFTEKFLKEGEEQEEENKMENKEISDNDSEESNDALQELEEVVENGSENEAETINTAFENKSKQIEVNIAKIQNCYIKNMKNIFLKTNGIEFILDSTMGQVINPTKIDQNRFTVAIKVLSLSLESLEPTKHFNIFSSDLGSQLSQNNVQISNFKSQNVADFLLGLNLHGNKQFLIELLLSRVQNSLPEISDILVLTDFTHKDYSSYQKLIEEALKARETVPRIHIFNFNFEGVETNQEKQASFEFFIEIAQLTKGSFVGVSRLNENVILKRIFRDSYNQMKSKFIFQKKNNIIIQQTILNQFLFKKAV